MSFKFLFALSIITLLPFFSFVAGQKTIDINSASLEELDELIGVGPAIGQRIIDARPFSSVEDLIKVKGIGEKTLQKIKDQGLACVSCQPEEPAKQTEEQTAEQDPEPIIEEEPLNNPDTENENIEKIEIPKTQIADQAKILESYASGIFINEILSDPEGSDQENEWIELYNSNNFDVDLGNWKIQDLSGSSKIYTIKQGTKISSKGFLVLKRTETKITLNNDEDGVALIYPDGKVADSVNYQNAKSNHSWSKIGKEWEWSETLTPAAENIKNQLLPDFEENDNNIFVNGSADASLPLKKSGQTANNPLFLFFTVLITTIVSALILFIFKTKFLNKT